MVIYSRRGRVAEEVMSLSTASTITPDQENELYELIKAGNFPTVACQAVGLHPSTYARWIKRGEYRDREGKPTPDQVRFANRMREAEAMAETEVVKKISAAVEKDPEMGLKFLSRRFRARWAESREVNVNWTIKAVEAIKSGDLTLDDLRAELGDEMTEKVKQLLPQVVEGEFVDAPIEAQVRDDVDV